MCNPLTSSSTELGTHIPALVSSCSLPCPFKPEDQTWNIANPATIPAQSHHYLESPYLCSWDPEGRGSDSSLPLCSSGLESPSHALRADALPHASSAATICVTLAEGHPCDRALEILLHPSGERRGTQWASSAMLMKGMGSSFQL